MSVNTRSNTANQASKYWKPGLDIKAPIISQPVNILNVYYTTCIQQKIPQTTELLFIPPSGVFFARNWSQSKHVTPSQMSKFLLLENISLSKARWASWCNPLQAGAFLFVGPKVLKRLHMWKIRVAGTNVYNLEVGRHISKVQKYRLLTTYYIFLLAFLEISKWLTQLFWQS